MSNAGPWAEALHLPQGGNTLRASVLRHIRDAVREAGYVSRGRITSGIKEAYRPVDVEEEALQMAIDEALVLLMQTGDIGELATGAGRGYAPTPPRRVIWGGANDAVLGAVAKSSGDAVRRVPAHSVDGEVVSTLLLVELGRPGWRDALVELNGTDQPNGDARSLSTYAQSLASSGERCSLDEPNAVAVLSSRGEFFGSPDGPSGRWTRAKQAGFYPAVVASGYGKRRVLLMIDDGAATLWEPPSRDVWNWIVVGATLANGEPVWRYDRSAETFDFLTPPPRQAERAVLLTGEQLGAWSWRIDPHAQAIIADLMGSTRP